jgi:hypothetical protein
MVSLLSRGASDRAVGPPKVETRASEKTRSLKPTPALTSENPELSARKTWSTASENRQPLRRSDPRRRRRPRPSMTARPAYCTFRAYLGRTPHGPNPEMRRPRGPADLAAQSSSICSGSSGASACPASASRVRQVRAPARYGGSSTAAGGPRLFCAPVSPASAAAAGAGRGRAERDEARP